jgi:hypothetical protein
MWEGKLEVRLRSDKSKEETGIDEVTGKVLELRRSLYQTLNEKAEAFSAKGSA